MPAQLRIFSYLPNPRIWNATIAARLCGVEIEVRGAAPQELQSWLWDFDARPLSSDEEAGSADVRVGQTVQGQGLAPILDPLLNDSTYARAAGHFARLRKHPAFVPDVEPYLEKIAASAEHGVP